MKNVMCMQRDCKNFVEPQWGYHNDGALDMFCGCWKIYVGFERASKKGEFQQEKKVSI